MPPTIQVGWAMATGFAEGRGVYGDVWTEGQERAGRQAGVEWVKLANHTGRLGNGIGNHTHGGGATRQPCRSAVLG
jgi:hypothetical protein